MFARAEKPFLTLLERLSPSRIIVLGKEMWDNMPSTAAFFTQDIQAYALPGDALAWALALAHPRAKPQRPGCLFLRLRWPSDRMRVA